jgi:hypothetical protein
MGAPELFFSSSLLGYLQLNVAIIYHHKLPFHYLFFLLLGTFTSIWNHGCPLEYSHYMQNLIKLLDRIIMVYCVYMDFNIVLWGENGTNNLKQYNLEYRMLGASCLYKAMFSYLIAKQLSEIKYHQLAHIFACLANIIIIIKIF